MGPGPARLEMKEVPGTEFTLPADLVLIAMGFVHVVHAGLVEELGLQLDNRGNVVVESLDDERSRASLPPATRSAGPRWWFTRFIKAGRWPPPRTSGSADGRELSGPLSLRERVRVRAGARAVAVHQLVVAPFSAPLFAFPETGRDVKTLRRQEPIHHSPMSRRSLFLRTYRVLLSAPA